MASQKTKFSVGLFVLAGIVIALGGVLWIGMTSLFQKGDLYVTYFDESVQGLDVDSPVKYRGVTVGRVERIDVAPDSKLIEVVLKIEGIDKIREDVVAQLQSVGITGLVFVGLDRIEGVEKKSPDLSFPTPHRVIPTVPSDIQQIMEGIDALINQVKDLDLGGVSQRLKVALESGTTLLGRAERAIEEAGIREISRSIQRTMADVNRVVDPKRWNRIVGSVEEAVASMNRLLANADRTVGTANRTLTHMDEVVSENRETILEALERFEQAMGNANRLLEEGSGLVGNANASVGDLRTYLIHTAQNLEKASENLTRIIETLADQPSELLFGEPPPRREVETEP